LQHPGANGPRAAAAASENGVRAGVFRPITLWPFPVDALGALLPRTKALVIVEGSPGQLEDEMRLALSHAGLAPPPIFPVRHYGGVLPAEDEILGAILAAAEART